MTSDVNENADPVPTSGPEFDESSTEQSGDGAQSRDGQSEEQPRSLKDALIPDHALHDATGDALGHDAFAEVIADLVVTVESPSNVALFGPWGSGKSSLYGMVKARVVPRRWPWKPWPWKKTPGVRMVRYDAWKFAGHSLQRNFLSLVASELRVSQRLLDRMYGARETSRLRLGRYLWRNKWSLLLALLVGVVVGAAWTVVSAWAAHRWGVGVDKPVGFKAGVVKALPSGGVVVGAVLAALLLGNQAMASAVEKRSQSPLQDADQFSAAFDKLMRVVTRRRVWWWLRVKRLVVFIDELDRCQSHEVVSTLRDLMTFLDHKDCVFLVAADREVLEEALEKAPQVKPLRENEPYYSTAGAFLDKVFQHQMPLPPTRTEALTVFARDLADERGGLWETLRDTDKAAYEDVVYSLVPAHVRSPRRVKVLMNNFVTAAHVLEAREMHWADRAAQVAVLTVLQTEFPSVVRDFLQQPRLLEGLLGLVEDPSPELTELVKAYDPESGTGMPAPLMSSDDDNARRADAQRRLNEQLDAYLGKVHAAGIPLPTPDLVYSRTAAHADGLADEALARLLDVAADTAPDTVVAAFEDASMSDRQAAVLFLVSQLGNKFGPLRANLVESACRIGATLDVDHAREVARRAANAILGEARGSKWRSKSTAGALWLGLLDPQTADPLALLEPTGELANLAGSGALATLMPLIPNLGERATPLFAYIGAAYADYPGLVHDALRTFPSSQVERLWASQSGAVTAWFADVEQPTPAPATTTARAATAAAPTEPNTPTPTTVAEERYAALLTALIDRPVHDISNVVVDVAQFGLAHDEVPSLHAVLWDHHDALFETITDGTAKTRLALVALATVTELDYDEVFEWVEMLDAETSQDPVQVQAAAERIAKDLCGDTGLAARFLDDQPVLVRVLRALLPFLTQPLADDVAKVLLETLVANPPIGTTDNKALRNRLRAGFALLDERYPNPSYEHGYMLKALLDALDEGQVTEAAAPQFLDDVKRLPATKAALLDGKIAAATTTGNDAVTLVRLRVAARSTGGMSALPSKDLLKVKPTTTLLHEWFATKPPLAEATKTIRKWLPATAVLEAYAQSRKVNERSRFWIALEATGCDKKYLEAVGKCGVNETVVAHMSPRIVGATLPEQTAATKRLVTASLSTNTATKDAANTLAITLLKSSVIGAGPNAAAITLAAEGAASGRKPELKKAFDTYISGPSQHIGNPDLRALNRLGLFTPKKKSPLATFFGWFK